jgi:hypothetical protein
VDDSRAQKYGFGVEREQRMTLGLNGMYCNESRIKSKEAQKRDHNLLK